MKLNEYLKQARTKSGLTQFSVAGELGLHVQYISNVERGACNIPVKILNTYIKMCGASKATIIKIMIKDHKEVLTNLLVDK